ncbi:MAG: MBL fold metallo-hydrolase [Armatimonadetes bacterium]|nr:MBL fold metallo-hydrolase [Armatimonadota bacterium]
MTCTLQFCGAAETVTGSKHLLRVRGKQILVDCGLFQGKRELRERNWQPLPIQPHDIDAVVITHAHMDHIGYLPRLVAQGYRGPIYATPGTIGLSRISLPDSGRLQEDDARYRNKHALTRHKPALPLYTEADAFRCLKRFEPVRFDTPFQLPGGVTYRYLPAGHILGSAFASMDLPDGQNLLMSGDLGRYDTPILLDPEAVADTDYLVVESTYGDRLHSVEDPELKLEHILNEAWEQGQCIITPSFAIGRTQELLFYIKRLQDSGRIKRVPIFVDSPMASEATVQYLKHTEEYDREARLVLDQQQNPLEAKDVTWVRDREQSKELNSRQGPMMIISGSGMCNGGRVVHHLLARLERTNTVVLFTGYQAEGTLGRDLIEGEPTVRVLGQEVEVRAKVEKVNALSAHADQGEILRWLSGFQKPPKRTFIVHGEPKAQAALANKIGEVLGWNTTIPRHLETVELV